MEWHNWITQKYVEWRGLAVGRERTVKDFAAYVGVSQQSMSSWMKPGGNVPKHKETIDRLAEVFGPEVYGVLGLDVPEPEWGWYGNFSPDEKESVLELIRGIHARKRTPSSAP